MNLDHATKHQCIVLLLALLTGTGEALVSHLKSIEGIQKLHHFRFSPTEPGTMYVKESIKEQ